MRFQKKKRHHASPQASHVRILRGDRGVNGGAQGAGRSDRVTNFVVPETVTKYDPHFLGGAGLADCWLYARFSVDGFVGLGVLARTV